MMDCFCMPPPICGEYLPRGDANREKHSLKWRNFSSGQIIHSVPAMRVWRVFTCTIDGVHTPLAKVGASSPLVNPRTFDGRASRPQARAATDVQCRCGTS